MIAYTYLRLPLINLPHIRGQQVVDLTWSPLMSEIELKCREFKTYIKYTQLALPYFLKDLVWLFENKSSEKIIP